MSVGQLTDFGEVKVSFENVIWKKNKKCFDHARFIFFKGEIKNFVGV